ncbi:MAG: hypothetical protein NUV51_05945 [Sulfuricaulis sp.]|nr:hypothetical protein [Sulfuricaulis sp.]
MRRLILIAIFFLSTLQEAVGEISQRVVDIPTRSGVTQQILLLTPTTRRAAVILFAGGHGGLRISSSGDFSWGEGNFLVRTRQQFADKSFVVAVVDASSDRQSEPYLSGYRQTAEHVSDIKAVIAWLRSHANVPVWLIGTSRGTQSAAYVATELSDDAEGPDGLVLTATILTDNKSRPVPDLPMQKLKIPVLVVHHEQDGCKKCPFSAVPDLMKKLYAATRKELLTFHGGNNVGDPCEARAYHGFNGLEQDVVDKIAAWIVVK